MVVMHPDEIARLVDLDHLIRKAPVGGAVGAPHLVVEAARLDHVVERGPQVRAAEAKVEGMVELRVEEDGHAAVRGQRCRERGTVLLGDGEAGAADPLDARVGLLRPLLGRDRILIPCDRPAASLALSLADHQRQDVCDDQHGATAVILWGERGLSKGGARGRQRRQRRQRRLDHRKRQRHVAVELIPCDDVRTVGHEHAVALDGLPALQLAVGDHNILVLQRDARGNRDRRRHSELPAAGRRRVQRHAAGRFPAAERRMVADDVHREAVGVH